MKERPILFSGPMVRAILEGRKTQTRRVVKPQSEKSPVRTYQWKWTPKPKHSVSWNGPVRVDCPHCSIWTKHCPHGTVGDRLWVRETWSPSTSTMPLARVPNVDPRSKYDVKLWYAASNDRPTWAETKWHPSIHMPRWASRLTLEITGVRVERLQEISEEDAIREGCDGSYLNNDGMRCDQQGMRAGLQFQSLWQSINGPESWAANPWVWVIEFRRVQQ